MKPAEFEEKEYEGPLYHQLCGDGRVWSPGQVLEKHVGFDHALFSTYDTMGLIWDFHGLSTHRPGMALSRYAWYRRFLPKRTSTAPNFRLNLFIQAKRPNWGTRPPTAMKRHGLTNGPYWKFSIDADQQAVLERLSMKAGSKALIVYAAAAFHEKRHLYLHTRRGTVPHNSTFPPARLLAGHRHWYYQKPGAVGVASSTPTEIFEKPIFEQIQNAIDGIRTSREAEQGSSWIQNLSTVANDISAVLENEELAESRERAEYFSAVRTLRQVREWAAEGESIHAWTVPFVEIAIFASVFDLEWYVLADA